MKAEKGNLKIEKLGIECRLELKQSIANNTKGVLWRINFLCISFHCKHNLIHLQVKKHT